MKMKRLVGFVLACLLLMGAAAPAVLAEEFPAEEEEQLWSDEYYRAADATGSLSNAEIRSIDTKDIEFMERYHVDCAELAIPDERLEGYEPEEFAEAYYENCDFGYGEGKDGYMCLYLTDSEKLYIVPMGEAKGILPQNYLEFVEERVPSLREKHGIYGVLYGCVGLINSGFESLEEKRNQAMLLEDTHETEGDETESIRSDEEALDPELSADLDSELMQIGDGDFGRTGEDDSLPVWFPADLSEAYVYTDPEAPRVVDYADAFSDECEAAMRERIAQISEATGKDIVIVTDVSNYGLGDDIYVADFYDYNGYGIGDEHEGICIFLNLDPNERGVYSCETGSKTKAVMTQRVAERLDDFLFDNLRTGDWEKTFTEWIEDVNSAFTTGIVRPPFWYPEGGIAPDNYRNPDAPLVLDEAGVVFDTELEELKEAAKSLKETYGVNVYFHTTNDDLGMDHEEYDAFYLKCMGYDPDCVLIAVDISDGYSLSADVTVRTYGEAVNRIPEKYRARIENLADDESFPQTRMIEAKNLLEHYLAHGRVPRGGLYWALISFVTLLGSGIFGSMTTAIAKQSMKSLEKQTTAFSYVDKEKTKVTRISSRLLHIYETSHYNPPKETRSSGGSSHSSSGGRSYTSSYSGHSGTSHSGHGGKF